MGKLGWRVRLPSQRKGESANGASEDGRLGEGAGLWSGMGEGEGKANRGGHQRERAAFRNYCVWQQGSHAGRDQGEMCLLARKRGQKNASPIVSAAGKWIAFGGTEVTWARRSGQKDECLVNTGHSQEEFGDIWGLP
eukprot:GGOE01027670.1.p1 GENE.GGOE01027670.1~~GGOE01027670.1.p1  ORF type:complete len:152 (-),score=2.88 GGOE01027670.1:561-971(-)